MEKNESLQIVKGLDGLSASNNTNRKIFTNIQSENMLFNLDGECDHKLNDCIGEKIRVKYILIKEFEKEIELKDENGNNIIDEDTGEVKTEVQRTIITILLDDNKTSYVTKSKMFAMRLKNYLQMFGFERIENEGLDILITTQNVKNSSFKALSFDIVED